MSGQCRADGLIDPDAIPGANIDAAKVETAGTAFSTSATDVETRGGEVKTAWAKLGSSYTTPDSTELLAVMDGVETDTAALAATLQKASTFIGDYATAVAPIAKRLVELKAEAATFVEKALKGKTVGPWDPEHPANQGIVGLVQNFGEVLDDVHLPWDQYTPYVDENNELLTKVAEQETKLSAASAECVNAINGLRTDMCLAPVQAVDYTAAVKANEPMPWGSTGRGDQSCQESFDSGVYDAAKGTVEGLGGLIGYNSQTGEWGDGDWAAQSWKGFAESLGLIVLLGSPPLLIAAALPKGVLPDVVGDTARNIMDQQKTLVEGFVGSPEDWRDDPAHAAGGAAFNIGTLFIPGAGEIGAGAKVAALGSRLAVLGADGSKLALIGSKVAAAGTTIVRVGDALSSLPGKALSGVSDLLARGRGGFADALRGLGDKIPTVNVSVEHAMATPDGFGVGVGRPHIEVGHPEPGSHWLHSVADNVDGGGGDAPHSSHPSGSSDADSQVLDRSGTSGHVDSPTDARVVPHTQTGEPINMLDGSGAPAQIRNSHLSQAFIDNGGLRAHEGIRGAHTMSRHFDGVDGVKSDAEIAGRDDLSSAGNSAFRLPEEDLNRLIGRTLDSRADEISNWLNMEPKPKPRVFTITATFDQVIGRRFSNGVFTDEKQMWMQLLWDKNSPGGFVVRTAYPTRLGG
ncbi:hypothetical protein ACTHQN_01735 [Curtobacterium flaccumfaciens]|uniref:hypothetical protein n=1 Tax=Curtobacterium flaccumfaciens TaxID=2035 RepID=UPI003F7D148B